MSHKRLTKREALDLITPVVDGEVDQSTQKAFFRYLKKDLHVRRRFESEQRIKYLLSKKFAKKKAPESLKKRVADIISEQKEKQQQQNTMQDLPVSSIPDHPDNDNQRKPSVFEKWLYAAAASFMVLAAFWGLVYPGPWNTNEYQIEKYVYQHFTENNGQLIEPNIATASVTNAEIELSRNYDLNLTIPPLKNAEFQGVVYEEFVPGFEAPLLEYHLSDQDQNIYIFAFDLEELDKFKKLSRDDDAVKKCDKPEDFHVREIEGKHIVSWKWNDVWYAAISNHDGEQLAALIEPLKYDPEETSKR